MNKLSKMLINRVKELATITMQALAICAVILAVFAVVILTLIAIFL